MDGRMEGWKEERIGKKGWMDGWRKENNRKGKERKEKTIRKERKERIGNIYVKLFFFTSQKKRKKKGKCKN